MNKRAAVLTIALVAGAGVIGAWLADGDRGASERNGSVAADSPELLSPTEYDPAAPITADEPDEAVPPTTQPATATPLLPNSPRVEPVPLFAGPDYSSIDYRNALDSANAHLANSNRRRDTSSIKLLTRNEVAINELIRQLRTTPDGLREPFQISPPDVRACTISTIELDTRRFAPGDTATTDFSVESACDETGDGVTITVDNDIDGKVAFAIRSIAGGISIFSVDDSNYAVAFQRYP